MQHAAMFWIVAQAKVLSVNGTPAGCAISPTPVGAIANGADHRRPNCSID
jgi:hypothetical protein